MFRLISHRILLVLAVPFVFVGLIDPLEGGISLLLAGVIYLIAFLLAGHGPRKYLWVPYLAAVIIGAIVLVLAIFGVDRVDSPDAGMGPVVIGNWIYRVAVLITLTGAITAAILSFRARKKS